MSAVSGTLLVMTSSPSKEFGYVRVSTVAQSLDRQVDALLATGIPRTDIFSDKISGSKQSRPGLGSLLAVLRPGDTVWVHSLDRLGRTALHVMTTISELTERIRPSHYGSKKEAIEISRRPRKHVAQKRG